jgi:signal transduction histidine kinase
VRRRLIWATLAVVAVSVLALGLPLMLVTVRLVADGVRTELLRQVQTVAVVVENGGDRLPTAEEAVRLVPPGEQVRIEPPVGAAVVAGPDPGEGAYEASAPLPGGGTVTVARPGGEVRGRQWRLGLLVAAGMATAGLLAAAAAVLVARRLSDPLRDVADRAARLGAGDFRPSPRRHGVPELDRVSDVLDRSAAEIADLIQRERALASDVSHQLRGRLTALRIRLEEMALMPDPAVRKEATAALEQAERLSGVVDDVLAQARQARSRGVTGMDVAREVAAVVDERSPELRRLGREILVDAPDHLVARADPGRFQQAVGVLVDNALTHGAGTVRVGVRRSAGHALVEVTDEGPGVPAELVPRAFERGVSGGESTGIGLALARALVESDGGRLELSRPQPPVFAVYLPLAERNGA